MIRERGRENDKSDILSFYIESDPLFHYFECELWVGEFTARYTILFTIEHLL